MLCRILLAIVQISSFIYKITFGYLHFEYARLFHGYVCSRPIIFRSVHFALHFRVYFFFYYYFVVLNNASLLNSILSCVFIKNFKLHRIHVQKVHESYCVQRDFVFFEKFTVSSSVVQILHFCHEILQNLPIRKKRGGENWRRTNFVNTKDFNYLHSGEF